MSISPDAMKIALILTFSTLVILAAVRDIGTYTIPNWLTAALAVAFVPAAFLAGVHPLEILTSLGIGAALLVAGVAMFAMKWMGGGDAKLLAAASLWLGVPGLASFILCTGLAGGVLAMGLLAMRSAWLRPYAVAGPSWVGRLATPGGAAPYGVAIAIGALAAFPQGLLMRAANGGF
ncbi:MAG TPA: prepilin peptidase [Caulobacteraceae bacterium]|nr:prepilin peptidase [Caulobacteraceae bacterium]